MKRKHTPLRTCLGCGRIFPKSRLMRFVLTVEGAAVGDHQGRGYYLCPNAACVERALTRKNLNRILGRRLSPEDMARLRDAATRQNGVDVRAGGRVICWGSSGGGTVG